MRVGILQCDEVRERFRDQGFVDYPQMIIGFFESVGADFEYTTYRCFKGEIPADVAECDAYITSGSRYSVLDEEPWMLALEAFLLKLLDAGRPYVGICFGHQLLAKALGGVVENAAAGWGIGVSRNRIVERHFAMPDDLGNDVNLLVSHQDQVTLPPEIMKTFGGSDFCPHYFCSIDTRALTIQGHPEFSIDYSRELMEFRRDIIPAPVVEAGMDSLHERVDGKQTFRWITRFMQQGGSAT